MPLIFGFGSLMNPASANRTLRRATPPSPPREIFAANLRGWQRRWQLVSTVEHDAFPGQLTAAIFLDIAPLPADAPHDAPPCNGVLIPVSDDELARLDEREAGYDRVDVTAQLEPFAAGVEPFAASDANFPLPPGEVAMTYVAKPHRKQIPAGAIVPARYEQTIDEALTLWGDAFRQQYAASTVAHAFPTPAGDYRFTDGVPRGNTS